jgi:hypothetical protein
MQITENWGKDEHGELLYIEFGKNGQGITDEMTAIGKRIEELSKDFTVYLHHESFIDTADDVYTLKFALIKKAMQETKSEAENAEENSVEFVTEETRFLLNVVSPISVQGMDKGSFKIVDVDDSEYFFYQTKTGKLAYDGCCVNADKKQIVFDHLGVVTPEEFANGGFATKSLHNTTANGAKENVRDIQFWGDGDTFLLISKASSEAEGWMKSTKAMPAGNSVVVQVTTQQRNPDGSYSLTDALTTVENAIIWELIGTDGKAEYRTIVPRTEEHKGMRTFKVSNGQIQQGEKSE